ncbi:MAG: HAD family hydrolase [Lachnospiraceae bacterium]|nr:HAD family hydrolase [Lachnospiraceae bacterium]
MIKAEHKKEVMLLFDLDGTLWDSGQEVADSWNLILKEVLPDFPHLTAADITAVMGKTMEEIRQTVLPDMDEKKGKAIFKTCEEFEVEYIAEHGGKLFPGVMETFQKLRDEGYDMAVVSNCQTGYINAFFVSMKTGDFFCDMEEWGNTGLTKDKNIRLVMERNGYDKAIYIGDTEKDEAASDGAGIPFIHASYGFGQVKAPAAVLKEFKELPEIVKKFE